MKNAIIGKKLGMTQVFDEAGNCLPVTLIEAGPCVIVQKKTVETDGYSAVKIGFDDVTAKKLNKPERGQFDKAGAPYKRVLKEFDLDDAASLNIGDVLTVDRFAEGESVDITGTSKGKGYAGAIKRWNHARLKETHGTGPVARHAGSLGACSSPSRVYKGMKGAGHLGAELVTVQNLEIVKIDAENNLIAIKGAIPGARKGIVVISDTVKKA